MPKYYAGQTNRETLLRTLSAMRKNRKCGDVPYRLLEFEIKLWYYLQLLVLLKCKRQKTFGKYQRFFHKLKSEIQKRF